ncbi:MAG TPA: HNH endonuclease [Thermoleophilia bacterium]|nr:HNH endonuclease [Thermoleophilia bacterium]
MDRVLDTRVRTAAFNWLSDQMRLHGDVLPRELLAQGFVLDDVRVPLVGPPGIFKPKMLANVPLSLTTIPDGPYDDDIGVDDGLIYYRYRGTDPNHRDNQGMREAMRLRLPLIYFHRVAPGRYYAAWPVYIVHDDPGRLTVTVAVDDREHVLFKPVRADDLALYEDVDRGRRSYITAEVKVRLHQRGFRERVLEAYRRQCAFCHLRHEELLDAAHIIPDWQPLGDPIVRNGLSLCALHHGTFDRNIVGLRPDYVIEVRPDILRERDGPTLAHAIQGLHGQSIILPRTIAHRPDPDRLALRYGQFRQAS